MERERELRDLELKDYTGMDGFFFFCKLLLSFFVELVWMVEIFLETFVLIFLFFVLFYQVVDSQFSVLFE